jgi:class 3 adenylate cyclase
MLTFLFADVEGSTRRWEAAADATRAALAVHHQVSRKAIEALGGWLFKHTGFTILRRLDCILEPEEIGDG